MRWFIKTPRLFSPALYCIVCVQSSIFPRKKKKKTNMKLQLFTGVDCMCWGNLLTLLFVRRRGGRGRRWGAAGPWAASPGHPRYGHRRPGCALTAPRPPPPPPRGFFHVWHLHSLPLSIHRVALLCREKKKAASLPEYAVCLPFSYVCCTPACIFVKNV